MSRLIFALFELICLLVPRMEATFCYPRTTTPNHPTLTPTQTPPTPTPTPQASGTFRFPTVTPQTQGTPGFPTLTPKARETPESPTITPQTSGIPRFPIVTPTSSKPAYPKAPTPAVGVATVGVATVQARRQLPVTKGPPFTTSFKRTVVFLKKKVDLHQYVFIRGGKAGRCHNCPIAIRHHVLHGPISGIEGHSAYKVWSTRDDKLDWDGQEGGQGWYERDGHRVKPQGTPMMWTTNNKTSNRLVARDGYGYVELNTYGPHYWMMDVLMDCSQTQDGWFTFKGLVQNLNNRIHDFELESDVGGERCGGSIGTEYTYPDQDQNNHYGRCGAINVFAFSSNREKQLCLIKEFPPGQQWSEAFNKILVG